MIKLIAFFEIWEKGLKTYLTQGGEENKRVTEVCERSIKIKRNEVLDKRKDSLRSQNVYRFSYDISFFVS
jgi:hypothetical protein